MLKYGIDNYGNTYITEAQYMELQGEYVLNPNCESFITFPEIPEGKRVLLSDGKWAIADIDSENVFDKEIGFIRPKNQDEKILTGLDPAPAGMKIENGEIVPMSLDEQLKANQITEEQYKILSNAPVKNQLQNIDIKSIRSLREWLVSQSGAPDFIKTYETDAQNLRKSLK